MSETLHSRNRARIAVGMQSGNNVISKLVRVKTDTKTNTMRTAVLNGLGLNVTIAAGQQKPIAMNIKQRIIGTKGKQKGEPMSDLISRAAAIDVAKQHWYKPDIAGALAELPSAQPEIIRCKDCKWYGRADKRRFYRGMDCLQKRIDTIIPDKDFCSRAERRTDE